MSKRRNIQLLKSAVAACAMVTVFSGNVWSAGATRDIAAVQGEQRRIALVIGNDKYVNTRPLTRAVADASAVKEELSKRGFQVIFLSNASRRQMLSGFEDFVGMAGKDAIAMVYYAGHGVEVDGENYLLPVDIEASKESDLKIDGVNLPAALSRLGRSDAKFTLAVIDACRDNPFKDYADAAATRSLGATRNIRPTTTSAAGMMIVYSAGNNQTALDSLGKADADPNGLFTREFIRAMRKPGLTVQEVMTEVKDAVISKADAIGHKQTPALYDQSVGKFVFTPVDPEEEKRQAIERAADDAKATAALAAAREAEARAKIAEAQAKEAELRLKQLEAQLAGEARARADADVKKAQDQQLAADAQLKAQAGAQALAEAQAKEKLLAEAQAKAEADAKAKSAADTKAKELAVAEAQVQAKARAEAQLQAQELAKAQAAADAQAKLLAKQQADVQAKETAHLMLVTSVSTNLDKAIAARTLNEASFATMQREMTRLDALEGGRAAFTDSLKQRAPQVAAKLAAQQPKALTSSSIAEHSKLIDVALKTWPDSTELLTYKLGFANEIGAEAERTRVAQIDSLIAGLEKIFATGKLTENSFTQAEAQINKIKAEPAAAAKFEESMQKLGPVVLAKIQSQNPKDLSDSYGAARQMALLAGAQVLWPTNAEIPAYVAKFSEDVKAAIALEAKLAIVTPEEMQSRRRRPMATPN